MSLAPRIARTAPRSVRQERPGDSALHVKRIMALECCVPGCGSPESEPHHLLRVDNLPKGTGRRSEDRWVLPLCFKHHRRTVSKTDCAHGDHGDDEGWLAEKGIQARDLAKALWACRDKPDPLSAMQRVVYRAKTKG